MVYEEKDDCVNIGTNKPNITIGTADGHFFSIDLHKKKITIKHLLIGSKEFEVIQEGADNNEGRKLLLETIDTAFADLTNPNISITDIIRINKILYSYLPINGEIDCVAGGFIGSIDSVLSNIEYREELLKNGAFLSLGKCFRDYWQTNLRARFIEQLNIKD